MLSKFIQSSETRLLQHSMSCRVAKALPRAIRLIVWPKFVVFFLHRAKQPLLTCSNAERMPSYSHSKQHWQCSIWLPEFEFELLHPEMCPQRLVDLQSLMKCLDHTDSKSACYTHQQTGGGTLLAAPDLWQHSTAAPTVLHLLRLSR